MTTNELEEILYKYHLYPPYHNDSLIRLKNKYTYHELL